MVPAGTTTLSVKPGKWVTARSARLVANTNGSGHRARTIFCGGSDDVVDRIHDEVDRILDHAGKFGKVECLLRASGTEGCCLVGAVVRVDRDWEVEPQVSDAMPR